MKTTLNDTRFPEAIREFLQKLEAWKAEEIDWIVPDPEAGITDGFIEFYSDNYFTLEFSSPSDLEQYKDLEDVKRNSTLWSCCGTEVTGQFRDFMLCPSCHEHL